MTDLVPSEAYENVNMQKYDDDIFDEVSSSAKYLPRLQLCTARTDVVTDGLINPNHYGLVKDKNNVEDLGEELDVLVLAWRPKALEMGEEVLAVFDVSNPEFQRIRELSGESDSGCMFGPEFLVWIPENQSFATLFMGSASARREAKNVKALMGKAATLTSQKVENKKYKWQAVLCKPLTTPIAPIPEAKDLTPVLKRFLDPAAVEVEKDESEDSDRDR
jgi:hypothetical protein